MYDYICVYSKQHYGFSKFLAYVYKYAAQNSQSLAIHKFQISILPCISRFPSASDDDNDDEDDDDDACCCR